MSLENVNEIDKKEADLAGNLILYIFDDMEWSSEEGKEKKHLLMLQDKINTCLAYIQRGQYKEDYPKYNFRQAIIEIRFKYAFTEHCKRYLQMVQSQISEYAIKLEVYIEKQTNLS